MRLEYGPEPIPPDALLGQTIKLCYQHPYLINYETGFRCRLNPRVSRFIKLMLDNYPNTTSSAELRSNLDPLNLWHSTAGMRQIATKARSAFTAMGCKISFESISNVGYRLLIPIQIITPPVNIVIPSDAVDAFKQLLITHPQTEAVQDFVDRLGIRLL